MIKTLPHRQPRPLTRSWSKLWAGAAVAAATVWSAQASHAVTWTAGSTTDFNWSTTANWDAGLPTANSDVFFLKDLANYGPLGFPNPGALPNPDVITLGSGSVANSLTFSNKYTLTGGDLSLSSGLVRVIIGNSSRIDSQLIGTNGLVKEGNGSLVLGNALNSYTGATVINEGAVIITSQGALGTDTSAVTVTGNTTRGSGGGLLVIGSALDNTAGLTFSRDLALTGGGPTGDGTALNSVGNNRFTGNLTIGATPAGMSPSGGTAITATGTRLAATFGTTSIEGSLDLSPSGQTVQFGGNGNWDINATLTGAAALEKSGNGMMVLRGTNSGFSGIVQTSAGFLRIGSVAAMGTSTASNAINLNGGVLELRTDAPNFAAKKAMIANNATIFADRAIGGAGLDQTVGFSTLGLVSTTSTRTLTLNGRNGYGITFTGNMASGSYGPLTMANNLNGTLTIAGDFWNTTSTTARALIFSGNGDTTITGNILASGQTHTLTKQGSGTLTILGTGSTLTGSTAIEGGTLAINDFRALNNASTATIGLGSTSTTTGTLSIIGNNLTQANLTTSRVVNLRGTTGGGVILANQTGTSPGVIFTSNFTATGAGDKTLSLGGASTASNEIRGAIPDNSSTNNTTVRKIGAGTWMLSGGNTFTGGLQVAAGTMRLQDTFSAASRDVIADATPVSFVSDSSALTAGGILEYVGADGSTSSENLGSLAASAGAGMVKVTPGAGGTATLTFSGLGARSNGGTIDFVPAAGGAIVLGTAPDGYLGAFATFNGTDFAYAPDTANATLRAPVYNTDAGFVSAGASLVAGSHNLAVGNVTINSGAMTISSLKITDSPTINQTGTLTINTGANTAGGILVSGSTGAVISGTGISSSGSADLVFRIAGTDDVLTLSAPITSGTTGGLTKTGAGTLIISGANNQTGTTNINEGTVKLSGSGRLSASNVSLNLRQGATLDLNGVNTGSSIASLNGAGTISNSSATAATLTIGNNSGTGTFTGLIADGLGQVSVTKASGGAQTWAGLNTYTGVTTITSTGIVSVPNLTNIGQASGIGRGDAAANAASLVFTGASSSQSFGGLSYTGADSISIDRLFTFGGTAASSGARIQANGANNATLIFNNSGALAFSAGNTTAQGLLLGGASIGDNQFNPLITDNPNAAAGAAPTSLYKSDAGLWILGNAGNSYTGATQINAGALRADGTTLPANSPVVFNGGVLQTSGNFTRSLAATAAAGTGTVGWLSGTANGGFAASTDKLTVNLGGQAIPAQLTWGANGFVGGALILSSTTSLAEVELVNPIDLAAAARTVQVDFNPNTNSDFATLSGQVTGATGSGLTKTGSGILRLLGHNTYTGDTVIAAGTIRAVTIGNSTSTSSNFGAGAGKISVSSGSSTTGALAYVGSGETTDRLIELAGSTSSVIIESSGTGPLILTNVSNASTGTSGKTLFLRGDLNAANEITSVLANNSAGGALSVTKDDNGTWTLSAANTYSGTTTVTAGALGLGSNSVGAAGAVTSGAVGTGTLVSTNGTFFGFNGDRTINNAFTISGNSSANFVGINSLTFNGQLATTTGGNTTITNSLAAGKTLTFNSPTYTGTESTSTSIRTLVFNGSGDTILNSSVTDSTATTPVNINLNYQGYGSLTLGGVSTYSGSSTIQSGLVKLAVDQALPSGAGKGNLTINPGTGLSATLDLNGHAQTVNGLTATTAGTITIDNSSASAASLTFGDNNQNVTLIGGITNTGTGALSIAKTGTGTANLSVGPFNYKGSTSVLGGSLTIADDVTATNALSVTGAGSTLNLTGGLTAAPMITSVNVGDGAQLNLFNSQGTPLANLASLTLGNGAILNLNAGTTTDTLTLLAGHTASVAGQVTLNIRDTGSMAGSSTYDLLLAPGGGLTTGGTSTGSYLLSQIPGGFTTLTLNQSDTGVSLTTGQLVMSSIYWGNGSGDGKWNTVDSTFKGLNFSKDKAGTIVSDFVPGAGTNVVFQADSAAGGAITTTLEQGFRINALEFEGSATTPASVTIAPGALATNKLTIDPSNTSSADGINLKAGGPTAVTISAPLGLGSNQTWTVASGSTLTVSGPLSGNGTLNKAGLGKASLTAAADPTFTGSGVAVNGGALEITNAAALGSAVVGNLAPISLNNGGTFFYNNATSGTIANALTLNGGTLAAAGASQTYSGALSLATDSTVSTRDMGVTIGTTRTVSLIGLISGPGKMIVNGNTAVSGGSSISGTVVLSQANPDWSGGALLQQGTLDLRNEQSLGTGALTVNLGRILFKGAAGATWNQFAAGLTVDNPGANAVVELQADNQGSGDLFTTDITGQITLGSATSPGFLRLHHADSLSAMRLSGPIVLQNNGSIHTSGGTSNTQTAVIASVISESGGSFSLKLNGDTAWGSNNYQNIRLEGANTFTGGLTLSANTLDFSTVSNATGPASNLGMGGAAINVAGGNLRFIGATSQSTDRPLTFTGGTLTANGTGGATITYAGGIDASTTSNSIALTGTGAGFITGGLTQSGTSADINITSGNWTISGAPIVASDDIIVSNPGSVLNLGSTGVLTYTAGTSNGLWIRNGATVNLGANDVNGTANAGSLDFVMLADSGPGPAVALNTNGFNLSTPRLDVGQVATGLEGNVTGNGTITGTYTGTDYGAGFRFFRGRVDANLAGVSTILKQGLDEVILTGDNSGFTGTVAATRLDAGTLTLDYSTSNAAKLSSSAQLDLRGVTLNVKGGILADTVMAVNGLTVSNAAGANRIHLTSGGFSTTLNLGGLTRSTTNQSTLRIEMPALGGATTSTANGPGASLGGWLTMTDSTGTHFAMNDGTGKIVPVTEVAKNDVSTWAAADHINDTGAPFTGTIGSATIASLRFDSTGGSALNLAPTGVLSIATGGVLVTSNVNAPVSISGGTLNSGLSDVIFTNDSATADLTVSSAIRLTNTITKSGAGTLILSGNNTSTGNVHLADGTLVLNGGNAIGDNSLITLADDRPTTLVLNADETVGRLQGGSNASGAAVGVVDLGNHALTVNTSSVSYNGVFTGSGSITKFGDNSTYNLTGASTGFTGTINVNGGLWQFSSIGASNASAINVNKDGAFLIDNNGSTRTGARVLDTTPITLNSADGQSSSIIRGLWIRTDQAATTNETIGALNFASGANYLSGDASGSTGVAQIIADNFTRANHATVDVRARNLGATSSDRNNFRIGTSANETAFIGANLIGSGATATSKKIVPWAIGEKATATLTDSNMGNTFVTYVAGQGFVPLDLTNDYAAYTGAAATENAREVLTTDLTGLAGKTVNALALHDPSTAATAVAVTGTGAGQALNLTSGALLFTLNPLATGAHAVNVGGFDSGLTTSSGEYVIHVVNPVGVAATGPTLTATISSPLSSAADLTKSGRGTLVLTGTNVAGGGTQQTTLNEGVLEISSLANIGGNTGALVFAGGTLRLGASYAGDDLSTRSITFLNGGATIDTNGLNLALANSVGSGSGGFTKTGAGTLTLNAPATYTGGTTIQAGTVLAAGGNVFGTGDLTVADGATLDLGANPSNMTTVGAVALNGTTGSIIGSGTLTGASYTLQGGTVSASLSGAAGLLKTGTGALTLTGQNTFTGRVEIQGGAVTFDSIGGMFMPSSFGMPFVDTDPTIRLGLGSTGVTLNYTGAGHSTDRLLSLQGTTGGLALNANGTGGLDLTSGLTAETAGAKSITLGGTSDLPIQNTLGPVNDGLGTLAIVKSGPNNWTLTTANNYSGATSINEGKLSIAANQTMSGALQFGTSTSITTAGTLDLSNADATFGSLVSQHNSTTATSHLIVGAGHTLTITGNVGFGGTLGTSATNLLDATGGGALVVNNPAANGAFVVGGSGGGSATADLSGLASVSINLDPATGIVRVNPVNSTNTNDRFATLRLPATGAGTTSITANLLNIGDSAELANGQRNALVLGTGATTLRVNTVNIGVGARDIGAVTFANPSGSISLRAADGLSPVTFNMGTGSASTGVSGATGNLFDVTGHDADLLIGAMSMGTQNSRTSTLNNTFSFDQGTLSIQSLAMSSKAQNSGTAANTTSTVNLGGGVITIGTGAGNAITMAQNTGNLGSSIANLKITGGQVTINGNIARGTKSGSGTASASVAILGGSLNMGGHTIGSAALPITFDVQAGELLNLGELNGGAGLTKTGTGGFMIGGANSYTGPTNVQGGTFEVHGTLSGTTALNVAPGATLATSVSNAFSSLPALTLNGGTFATGGFDQGSALTGAEPTRGLGVLNLSASSTIDFGDGAGSHLVFAGLGLHTPGSFTLSITNWNGTDTVGTDADDRLVFSGLVDDFTSRFAQGDVSFNGQTGYTTYQLTPTSYLVAIPEPTSASLLALGALLASSRPRRRRTQ